MISARAHRARVLQLQWVATHWRLEAMLRRAQAEADYRRIPYCPRRRTAA